MEKGDTNAPERDENKGKVVMGKHIKAIAQRTSHITSSDVFNLPEALICQMPFLLHPAKKK
jgi:hypothetical protein